MVAGTDSDELGRETGGEQASWRAARRHTRRVHLLRLGLPVMALVIVGAMFLSFQALPSRVGELSLGDVGVSDNTVTMQNPNLTGHGSEGQHYEVTAERAKQELDAPDIVRLEMLSGLLRQPDGGWMRVEADHGVYDSERETLKLEDNIELRTHDGRRGYFEVADVDLREQTVKSDRPVTLEMPGGRVRADAMDVRDGGDTVDFRGQVVVDLRFDETAAREEADAE